ncbi:MAG: hypothetical protein ACE5HN_06910 [Nitrospiria bacterium]
MTGLEHHVPEEEEKCTNIGRRPKTIALPRCKAVLRIAMNRPAQHGAISPDR